MVDSEQTSTPPIERLTQSILSIHGIGVQRAKILEKLGLHTAADLLFFFPRSYEDFTELHQITELQHEQVANVVGVVEDIDPVITGRGKHILSVLVKQDNQFLKAVWFNQSFMAKRFQVGQRVLLRGKTKLAAGRFQMSHPKTIWLDADQDVENEKQLSPIYRLTEGINQRQMRELISRTIDRCAGLIQEAFPENLRKQVEVCEIETAIRQIHAPKNHEQMESARSRLVYQELFILQLALAIRRHRIQTTNVSPQLELTPKIRARIIGRLPFTLTETQKNRLP